MYCSRSGSKPGAPEVLQRSIWAGFSHVETSWSTPLVMDVRICCVKCTCVCMLVFRRVSVCACLSVYMYLRAGSWVPMSLCTCLCVCLSACICLCAYPADPEASVRCLLFITDNKLINWQF